MAFLKRSERQRWQRLTFWSSSSFDRTFRLLVGCRGNRLEKRSVDERFLQLRSIGLVVHLHRGCRWRGHAKLQNERKAHCMVCFSGSKELNNPSLLREKNAAPDAARRVDNDRKLSFFSSLGSPARRSGAPSPSKIPRQLFTMASMQACRSSWCACADCHRARSKRGITKLQRAIPT